MNIFQRILSNFMPPPPEPGITTKQMGDIVKRAYEAARPNEQFPKIPMTLSPNASTMVGAEKMRSHARHLDENHDLSISILDTLVGKIIGKGVNVTPMVMDVNGNLHADMNTKIRNAWKQWNKRPEITRQMSGTQADRLTCRTWLRDGEALNRFILGNVSGLSHHTDIPMSIELIEPDYLPFIKNEEINGQKCIQAIQLHKWGYPVFYHLLTQSPYEIYPGAVAGLGMETTPIPADQMLHIKFTRRMTQIRGITIFHGVILRLESIKLYEESEQIAARVAAAMTGYIKKDADLGTGETASKNREFEMHPGMVFDDLLPGEDVGVISSDRPNTGLLDFRNALIRAACSGTMSNFSAVAQYYQGTYSSQRQEMVESKTNYDILRDDYVSAIKMPTYRKFVEMGAGFGGLEIYPDVDLETLFDVDIAGVNIPWIDPKKEMEAFEKAKESRFMSRSQVIRLMGYDPIEVKAEIKKEEEEEPKTPAEDNPADNETQEDEENEENENNDS